jgi:CelD/BcsL family acetyltransferase involved in cellulose biosynthesis
MPGNGINQPAEHRLQVVNQLDENTWRAFVDRHPHGNIFHTPEMFRVFQQAKNHEPEVWATVNPAGEVLALLLPVRINVLDGPFRLLTTRAVAYGSALSAPYPEGQTALRLLMETYRKKVQFRVLFTELRNYANLMELLPVFQQSGFVFEDHLNFLIDLERPPDELWQSIRSNARRNIQKARKSGVSIEEIRSAQEVLLAYNLLEDVYKRIQVPLPDRSLFEAAHAVLSPQEMFKMYLARVNGDAIGVMTLLFYKNVVLYWYTGTLRQYASYRAGDLLVWHALETGQRLGGGLFDFGGGGKPDEKYGVRDFKAKFGGELVNFGRYTCIHSPLRYRLTEAGYQVLRKYL